MARERRALSAADKEVAFRIATRGLVLRYADRIEKGMTDAELAAALADALGVFGGSCGPTRLHVMHQGAGLKIWAGWHIVNHVIEQPLFAGSSTVAMARSLYRIADPDDPQLPLL